MYPGDLIIQAAEIPFLPPTPSGESIISCTLVMRKSQAELKRLHARKLGSVSRDVLKKIIHFIDQSTVIADEDKEIILDGLGDWV